MAKEFLNKECTAPRSWSGATYFRPSGVVSIRYYLMFRAGNVVLFVVEHFFAACNTINISASVIFHDMMNSIKINMESHYHRIIPIDSKCVSL